MFETIGQHIGRDTECLLEIGESLHSGHESFADDQERPRIGQDL